LSEWSRNQAFDFFGLSYSGFDAFAIFLTIWSKCSSSWSASNFRAASLNFSTWVWVAVVLSPSVEISEAVPGYGYVAYIDESGDDGLRAVKPRSVPGSSEWLVLAAVVMRADNQAKVAEWVASIRSNFRNPQSSTVHFADLNDAKKAIACAAISGLDLRCFVVASNKKNMQGYSNPFAGKIPSSNWFYCWLTRILLERVTCFVRDKAALQPDLPHHLRLEYSARGGLRYSQMNAYYEWMRLKRHNPYLPWGKICWEVIHPRLLHVYPHYQREGLQLADIVASAFFKACDKHDTGACDPRFAKLLRPRMGRTPDKPDGQIAGYGLKLMPSMAKARLDADQAEIFNFYGYPSQWWDPEAFS
jgi:hypothetical protein